MQRKKLYYIPGLISIIGLPVLFFFWPPEDPHRFTVVKLNLTSTEKDKPGIEKFTEEYVYHNLINKKIIPIKMKDFYWDEETLSLKENFSFIDNELSRLESCHDTSSVIKVQMSNQNSYADFVWLNNEAMIYGYRRYAFVGDDFYYFASPPPPEQADEIVGMPLDIIAVKPLTKWEIFRREMYLRWYFVQYRFEYLFFEEKYNKFLSAGFLLLILLPGILKIKRFSRPVL